MASEEIETLYTGQITCPYCGYEDKDSWEFGSDSGDINCGSCGEEFLCEPHIEVTYCTYKKVEATNDN